jgi:hypothetical protein
MANFEQLLLPGFPLNESSWFEFLPTVFILPVSETFYTKAKTIRAGNFQLTDHSQDIYFYQWLTKSYEKIVVNGNAADLFYVPTSGSVKEYNNGEFWTALDRELQSIISKNKVSNVFLDHSFIVATFPGNTRPIQWISLIHRNVRDLRFFRSDNDMTPNGRDIFIPYSVNRKHYSSTNSTKSRSRKNFFMMIGREAAGKGDAIRLWRTNLYNQVKNSKNALVAVNLSSELFAQGLLESDFCFVIPGGECSCLCVSFFQFFIIVSFSC